MNSPDHVPVLGILGGVASGKSTVSRMLAQRGAAVLDADETAHRVLKLPRVKAALREEFGDRILDDTGEVSRDKLGAEVFDEPDKLEKLNELVHPVIIGQMEEDLQQLQQRGEVSLIVLDAALLMEKGLDRRLCDALLFVDADFETRAARARENRGWSADEVRRREKAQIAPEEKKEKADFVVDNSGSRKALQGAIDRVWNQIVNSSFQ